MTVSEVMVKNGYYMSMIFSVELNGKRAIGSEKVIKGDVVTINKTHKIVIE